MIQLGDGTVIAFAQGMKQVSDAPTPGDINKYHGVYLGTLLDRATADETNESSQGSSSEEPFDIVYKVRVNIDGQPLVVPGARLATSMMGLNNYLEVTHEVAKSSPTFQEKLGQRFPENAIPGACCLVTFINGSRQSPVIIGFLRNPGTTSEKTSDQKLDFDFQFNGMKVTIDKDGVTKIEAGRPKFPYLSDPTGFIGVKENPIPNPASLLAQPFTIEFADDGSFTAADGSGNKIFMDPSITGPSMTIGNQIDKITIEALKKSISIEAGLKMELKTIQMSIAADQIAIGSSKLGIELLKLLFDIFDAMSKVQVATGVGPSGPLLGSPQWATVLPLLVQLKLITGSL